jgi:hypothetical protein
MDTDVAVLGNYPDMARFFLQQMKDIAESVATLSAHGESSIPAGADHVDVTHGLGVAPTGISITPEDGFDAPWEVPRAGIGITTFKVQYKGGLTQAAGTSGYFLWEAKE